MLKRPKASRGGTMQPTAAVIASGKDLQRLASAVLLFVKLVRARYASLEQHSTASHMLHKQIFESMKGF